MMKISTTLALPLPRNKRWTKVACAFILGEWKNKTR
jgi:hypothetical protein